MYLVKSLAFGLVLLVAAARPVHAGEGIVSPNPRAQALYESALHHLDHGTIDSRRLAIRDLEEATLLDRHSPACELLLARVYYQSGFLKYSRVHFERVLKMAPNDADGRFGLGQVWRRDWLKYLEPASLDRAIDHLTAAATLRPDASDPWLMLVPLLVEKGDLKAAADAAMRSHQADPRRLEGQLAVAYTSYWLGDVALADSLFHVAVPRLPKLARERFEDISPVASERDTFTLHRLSPEDQREFIARFWRENDPDLASPENEALLEYWSRVAHAYFLFFNPKRREWDERGEVYVRYGPPVKATYNPVGARLSVQFGTGPSYPANALVWDYPELGMSVLMQDRMLSEYYLLPMARDYDPDPTPNPDSLAKLGDELAVRGGRGVFPKLPRGVKPLPVDGVIACFAGDQGSRLLAQVESPGGPGDSLWAQWVVLDSTSHEIVRGSRELSPSACDATRRRVADFATLVQPGRYLVGLTVRGRGGRRGVYRSEAIVAPSGGGLALSDVVIACGAPDLGVSQTEVRIEPNPEARVEGS